MTTHFTSDLHLGHRNIAKYCGRPFAHDDEGVNEMNQALIEAWNGRVDADDTVFVLGDVALGKLGETLPLVTRLHGYKILVPGNHDRCWSGRSPLTDTLSIRPGLREWKLAYERVGFLVAAPGIFDVGPHEVWLDHFQYEPTDHETASDKFAPYRPKDSGGWLLHGHIHERWRQRGRQINVGVDAWSGRPVADHEIRALIEAGPNDLAPLPWEAS